MKNNLAIRRDTCPASPCFNCQKQIATYVTGCMDMKDQYYLNFMYKILY